MSEPFLHVSGLSKRFGGLVATDDVTLDLPEGEAHALIGPNGAGKTTLLGQLFGELRQDAGSIRLAGAEIGHLPVWARVHRGLARTFQIAQLLPDYTALDTVALAIQAREGHGFRFFADARKDRAARDEAGSIMRDVDLSARSGVRAADLAQGERKQLELATALASRPRLMLLDEPMAGLGPVESQHMVDLLASLKGRVTMLIVEHDMDAVFALADRISVLVQGHIIAVGSPDDIRANEAVQVAYLGEGDV